MKLFLDSADIQEIKNVQSTGLLDGITTNPTLILKSGRDHKETIQEIAKYVKGPISVEGIGSTCDQLVKDAEKFAAWAPNVVAKIPMTFEGLKAVQILSQKNIPTNVTLVFSVAQAVLVAKAGATYVSPFVGRLDDQGSVGMNLIQDLVTVYKNYGFKTKILVASIRSVQHIEEAAKLGADICTIPYSLFENLSKHHLTDKGILRFEEDYRKAMSVFKE
ncbi:MAG: fructose-6-phosphate aldolase [Candidatus Diapherotrites archaeon]|nr:fructose-6-phosphate aldolase [Candidatus Diapherotrites archaeon]